MLDNLKCPWFPEARPMECFLSDMHAPMFVKPLSGVQRLDFQIGTELFVVVFTLGKKCVVYLCHHFLLKKRDDGGFSLFLHKSVFSKRTITEQ